VNGRKTKIPCAAKGGATGTNKEYAHTWVTYNEAMEAAKRYGYAGVGFIIPEGVFFVDKDHIDPSDPIVQMLLKKFSTYAERSYSGNGAHLYGLCDLSRIPVKDGKLDSRYYTKNPHNGMEMYIGGLTNRFALFTGDALQDLPLADCTDALLELLETEMLREQEAQPVQKEIIEEGRRLLKEEIKLRDLDEKIFMAPDTYKNYLGSFGARNFEDMLIILGKRQAAPATLLEKVQPTKKSFFDNLSKMLKKNQNTAIMNKKNEKSIGINISNITGLKMQISKCCSPIPGDSIVGFVSKGQGIKVHRSDCPNVQNVDKGRLIDVYWDYTNLENKKYNVDLEIVGLDRPNLLSDVVTCLSQVNVNIMNINAGIKDLDANIRLTLAVENAEILQITIDNLKKIQGVATIKRVIH
jgi:hypothetical protein